jgi:ribosomal protein L7/L12
MEHGIEAFLIVWVVMMLVVQSRSETRLRNLELRLARLLQHVGFDADAKLPASEEVKALARTPGRKIAAIKAYREQTGAGLKEAKEEVERLMRPDA